MASEISADLFSFLDKVNLQTDRLRLEMEGKLDGFYKTFREYATLLERQIVKMEQTSQDISEFNNKFERLLSGRESIDAKMKEVEELARREARIVKDQAENDLKELKNTAKQDLSEFKQKSDMEIKRCAEQIDNLRKEIKEAENLHRQNQKQLRWQVIMMAVTLLGIAGTWAKLLVL